MHTAGLIALLIPKKEKAPPNPLPFRGICRLISFCTTQYIPLPTGTSKHLKCSESETRCAINIKDTEGFKDIL